MGKKKFDLGAVNQAMSGSESSIVSHTLTKIESPKEENIAEPRSFKRINFKKLMPSPLNDYPMTDIDEMESLLLNYGLLASLNVHLNEETDKYEIESGERRYTALRNLFQKYEQCEESLKSTEEYSLYQKNLHGLYIYGIPCNIEAYENDDDSVKARIIIHNETDRPYDPIRTSAKIKELSDIYTRKNMQLPKSERFNVNQRIAEELNGKYSERQIIRYKNFSKLTPDLQEAVVSNNLPLSDASKFHNLTDTEQHILAATINSEQVTELPSIDDVRTSIQEAEECTTLPDDAALLEQAKQETAQKILSAKSKKENKIKDTVQVIKKKTEQLLKDINAYRSKTGKAIGHDDLDDIKLIITNLENCMK